MTLPRPVSPLLIARMVKILRRSQGPVPGWRLARELGLSRLRSVGEAAQAARFRGIGITSSAKGYTVAKTRADRIACASRMERAARNELRAAAALRKGRVPQAQIPAVRRRRIAA